MKNGIAKIIGGVALGLILILLFILPVKWLWNGVMPELFGLQTISLWMSFKLSLLANLLFKKIITNSNNE